MNNGSRLPLLGWCLLASCAGGAREVGQGAIDRAHNGQGSSGGTGAATGPGASGPNVQRSVTMGTDAAPSLLVVRGRTPSSPSPAGVRAVGPGGGDGVDGAPGSIREGGYIVRRAGAATAATGSAGLAEPSPVVATAGSRGGGPPATSGVGGAAASSGRTEVHFGSDEVTASAPSRLRAPSGGVAMDRAPAAEMARPSVAPRIGGGSGMAPSPSPVPTSPAIPPGSTVTVTTTVAVTPPTPPVRDEEEAQQSAGVLTAASVGDADRFTNYLEYLGRHPSEAGEYRLDMTRRLRVRVVDANGRGVNAARLRLSGQQGMVEGLTHADGSYDYFPGLAAVSLSGVARLDVQVESVSVGADVQIPPQGDGQPVLVRLNAAVVPPPPVLDLGFLIDVTGSMGDELRYVNREIASIVQRVERQAPGVRVRLSATFYRDRVDEMVVQQIPFTTNVQGFAAAMQGVYASGGGDYPEDLDAGLDAAMNRLAWSEGAAVRVLVVVADAPPQHYQDTNFTWREAMIRAQQRGIRLLPVAASGADRRVEFLFRAMGAATSTPYVYLTDDSGVGGSHMEADTDRVAVERFNDALVRLIDSDLRGEGMHEPGRLGAER
jgi:hypothetical protein